MVKDCEVSLTLGRTGGFHLLASGKSIKKITSGWEWRQVTGRKLQEKMKGEMVQLQQHCLSKTSDAPWPNSCYYLSNSFTQLHKGQPDLWWGCAPAALRKQRANPWKGRRRGIGVCGAPQAQAGLRIPGADALLPWPHSPSAHSEFICSGQTHTGSILKSICSALSSPSQHQDAAFPKNLS